MGKDTQKRYFKAKISDLIPYANNARTHSEQQVKQIAGSLQKFGMVEPIIIDKDQGIIAGHGRVIAAEKLGWTEIDALEVENMSDTDKQAYILASNRLAELAGWNDEILSIELQGLLDQDFDVSLIGWTKDDLEQITAAINPSELDIGDIARLDQATEIECPECGATFTK